MFDFLVLEDDPMRHREFKQRFLELGNVNYKIVENASLCKKILETEKFDIVFLDHDLGGDVFVDSHDENTGAEVARWIALNEGKIKGEPIYIVHSLNPDGANYMVDILKTVSSKVYRIPLVWIEKEFSKLIIQKE